MHTIIIYQILTFFDAENDGEFRLYWSDIFFATVLGSALSIYPTNLQFFLIC